MTESLSNQFLPGIDWSHYGHDGSDPLGFKDSSSVVASIREVDDSVRRKESKEIANVPLSGLEKVSQFYGDKQLNQQTDVLEKMKNNIVKRPLPEGFSIVHSTSDNQPDGSTKHSLVLRSPDTTKFFGEEVGRMMWNGDTGRVSWFGINQAHRGLASHMITRAHELASDAGDVGPTHSEDLSNDSYNLMKRYASAFMPKNALIHGRTPEEQEIELQKRRRHR